MQHKKKEQLRGKVRKTHIFSHFYELYKSIAVELEAYGRYLSHKDRFLDERHDEQEALLIDIQNDIVAYAVVHTIETQEDADMMASFWHQLCLLYTSPSPRDQRGSRMPSSA